MADTPAPLHLDLDGSMFSTHAADPYHAGHVSLRFALPDKQARARLLGYADGLGAEMAAFAADPAAWAAQQADADRLRGSLAQAESERESLRSEVRAATASLERALAIGGMPAEVEANLSQAEGALAGVGRRVDVLCRLVREADAALAQAQADAEERAGRAKLAEVRRQAEQAGQRIARAAGKDLGVWMAAQAAVARLDSQFNPR